MANNVTSLLDRRQITDSPGWTFVRLSNHASIVLGDYIYIDGGLIALSNGTQTFVSYMNDTISIDLSKPWSFANPEKRSIPKSAPLLNRPTLWPSSDNQSFYSWGGWRSYYVSNTTAIPQVALWKFASDGSGGGAWSQEDTSPTAAGITRPAGGLGAAGNGVGYMLGGYSSSVTAPETALVKGAIPLPGLLKYDMSGRTWNNQSSAGYSTFGTGLFGHMQFVQRFGPNGLLLMMGGEATGLTSYVDNGAGLLKLNNITIYEPESKSWYSQITTGTPPEPRDRFCAVGALSPSGSYEIFVYGGYDAGQSKGYNDIYILSLPAFSWFKVNATSESPRMQHSCNIVDKRQLLIMGGIPFPSYPSGYQGVDPWSNGLRIFDMTDLEWKSDYKPAGKAYASPNVVEKWYQQNNISNIRWDSADVKSLFATSNITVPVIPNTKSSQSQSSHLSIGLIIGIAVASVVILAAIIGMSIIKIRRRRARAAARPAQFTGDPDVQKYLLTPQETGGNEIFEMGQYTQSHEMMPDKETMKKMAFELEGDQTRRKTPEPAG